MQAAYFNNHCRLWHRTQVVPLCRDCTWRSTLKEKQNRCLDFGKHTFTYNLDLETCRSPIVWDLRCFFLAWFFKKSVRTNCSGSRSPVCTVGRLTPDWGVEAAWGISLLAETLLSIGPIYCVLGCPHHSSFCDFYHLTVMFYSWVADWLRRMPISVAGQSLRSSADEMWRPCSGLTLLCNPLYNRWSHDLYLLC